MVTLNENIPLNVCGVNLVNDQTFTPFISEVSYETYFISKWWHFLVKIFYRFPEGKMKILWILLCDVKGLIICRTADALGLVDSLNW